MQPPLSGHRGRITASPRRFSVRVRAYRLRNSVSSASRMSRAFSRQQRLSSHAVRPSMGPNSGEA